MIAKKHHRPFVLTFLAPRRLISAVIAVALLIAASASRQIAGAQPANEKKATFYQAASTRRMAERLRAIGDELAKVPVARTGLADPSLWRYFMQANDTGDLRGKVYEETRVAYTSLIDGKSSEAVEQFKQLKESVLKNRSMFEPRFVKTICELLAISYLRTGEQQNCLRQHSSDSCLLPIQGSGIYAMKDGPHAAIQEYLEILAENPRDITSRWLLNIAYMTVGEYPSQVPEKWRIPPSVFASDYDVKRFTDVAPQLGLDVIGHAGGAVMEDFDNDGYLDLMVSSYMFDPELDQIRYFHNDGDGHFTERTKAAGLTGILGGLNMTSTDYNNDGYVDVFVSRGGWLGKAGHHPPSLLRNNGNGTFDDVTEEAGLLSFHPSQVAAWGDFDNDGWLDLFVGNESMPTYQAMGNNMKAAAGEGTFMSEYQDKNPCQLYHNNHDGTFTDVAGQYGLAVMGWVKGAAWGDFDNDGLPDLYVSRLLEPNLLFHNNGKDAASHWTFSDVTSKAGVAQPIESFPTWFWDYDNDGWLDIFVSGYTYGDFVHHAGYVVADYLGQPFKAETPRLYHNNHDGTFTDVTRSAKLNHVIYAMGSNFGDIDNDGYLDCYLGTGSPDYRALMPNRMFRNGEGRFFQDVTTAAGVGHLQKGHAVAFGDIDDDGDQDIYEVIGGAFAGDISQNVLFLNPGNDNHWITLKLEGTRSNRSAIGARIKVTVQASTRQTRDIYATVSTGGSFGASSLQQEIGLEQARAIRAVEITWPSTGKVQVFRNLKMDRIVRIREGRPDALPMRVKKLDLAAASPAPAEHHH